MDSRAQVEVQEIGVQPVRRLQAESKRRKGRAHASRVSVRPARTLWWKLFQTVHRRQSRRITQQAHADTRFEVSQTSFLLSPLSANPCATSASLPYAYAQSIWRYCESRAAVTARLTSFGLLFQLHYGVRPPRDRDGQMPRTFPDPLPASDALYAGRRVEAALERRGERCT